MNRKTILLLSPVVILRTPTDIFPGINIPVIAVAWQFTGLNPEEVPGSVPGNAVISCRYWGRRADRPHGPKPRGHRALA